MDKIKCLFPEEKNVDIVAIYPLAAEKGTLFITNSVNDVRAACLNDYYTLSTPTPLAARQCQEFCVIRIVGKIN